MIKTRLMTFLSRNPIIVMTKLIRPQRHELNSEMNCDTCIDGEIERWKMHRTTAKMMTS